MLPVDDNEIHDLALKFVASSVEKFKYLDVCDWVADEWPEKVAENAKLYDEVYNAVKAWAKTAREAIETFRKELRGKQQ